MIEASFDSALVETTNPHLTADELADKLLANGFNRLNQPDLKGCRWKNPQDRLITHIPATKISSIYSEDYNPKEDQNHMPIDAIIKLFKDGAFDWEQTNRSQPLEAYELPDGTYHIQTGRHRADAAIRSQQSEIQASVWTLNKT